jgi:hypothetical protein
MRRRRRSREKGNVSSYKYWVFKKQTNKTNKKNKQKK